VTRSIDSALSRSSRCTAEPTVPYPSSPILMGEVLVTTAARYRKPAQPSGRTHLRDL